MAANLVGHDSHGVVRTLRYVEWLQTGVQLADQELAFVIDGGCFALVDGGFGMGQTIGPQAVRLGIERAQSHGVSVIALRHAGHLGRIGDWAEMAAEAGCVSIHLVNVAGGRWWRRSPRSSGACRPTRSASASRSPTADRR